MPRKYFRKFLPTHASILEHRWLGRYGAFLTHPNLWHLNRHSVAGGVALGLFAGCGGELINRCLYYDDSIRPLERPVQKKTA